MLTDTEKQEILREAARYPHRQAAAIEALKIVQRQRGWVSGDIEELAELLDMTADEVEAVGTFFSHIYLKPLGRHIIFICDSISCWVMGSDMLREHLKKRLEIEPGETTKDGRFTLMPIACLGICKDAPAMMVDEVLFTKLDQGKIDDILRQYQ